MPLKKSTKYIYGFDWLRGLACVGVMLFHYTTQYQNSFGHIENWYIDFPEFGRFGVIIFFIISAYLALLHIKESDTIVSYGLKRAIRLYPAYWAGIILTSIVTYFFLPSRSRTLSEILINFTMLQEFFKFRSVDGVYWTLRVELIFYAFIGLLILFKAKKHILKISFLWIVLLYIINYMPNNMLLTKMLNVFIMKENGHIFISGIAVYNINYNKSRSNLIQCIVLIAMCSTYAFFLRSFNEGVFLTLLSLFVYIITEYEIKPIKALKGLEFFSKISYPLYLTHQFIGFAIIYNMEAFGLTSEIFIIIPVGVSILIALFMHKFIEIPMYKKLKELINVR